MGKGKLSQFNFSMGEISPTFYGRPDIAQYYAGCSTMENFYPLPEGGAAKVPGSVYAGEVKSSSKATRLIRFIRSESEAYVLELGDQYIRYWQDGERIESAGSPVETGTPYLEAELFELKYVKIGDSLYIVHKNHQPQELVYTSSTSWALNPITFTGVLFNATGDYPGAIGFYEQRLVLAGTDNDPQMVWLSKMLSYKDFSQASPIVDEDAIILELNGQRNYNIQWIESAAEILLGCYGGEVILSGSGEPITPTNYQFRYQSGYGSSSIQGKLFNESILFLQRNANILRDYYYQDETAAYHSPEVTFFNKHILKPGVVDVALMSDPYQIYWAVLANGEIAAISYNKAMQINGAYRLITDGYYESITVVPGAVQDELWAVVRREIDGNTVRYLEYIKPYDYDQQRDGFYLHCGKTYFNDGTITGATAADPVVITSSAHGLSNGDRVYISGISGMTELNDRGFVIANVAADTFELEDEDGSGYTAYTTGGSWEQQQRVITGLDHLEGESVSISPDGGAIGAQTVSSGQIDIGRYARKIHIGLPYTSKIKTMRLESGSSTILNKRRIAQIGFRFYKTLGGKAGPTDAESDLQTMIFRTVADPYGQPPQLFTGDKNLDIPGNWDEDGYVYFVHDEPLPCTVLAMVIEINMSER